MTVDCEWFRQRLEPYLGSEKWLVAYSGGLDSSVLLRLLVELRSSSAQIPSLEAIHINHGLNANADLWQQHCIKFCNQYQVPLTVAAVDVGLNEGLGVEAAARLARYQVFAQELPANGVLMMGHHLDDQIETFFLRLFRGSGVEGMAGMPEQRALGGGQLYRPILAVQRQQLEVLAAEFDLDWIDDDSNTDSYFDRNFLRHELLPVVEKRWPSYRKTMARALEYLGDSKEMISSSSLAELEICKSDSGGNYLLLEPLLEGGDIRAGLILRAWLSKEQLPVPRSEQLKEFVFQLNSSSEQSSPLLQGQGYELRSYQKKLYLLPPEQAFDSSAVWALELGCALEISGVGTLKVESFGGQLADFRNLSVRFRQGGERCRPSGRQHSQSLKKLLQEYQVEPWLRPRVPLVYQGEYLLAVADYWVCADTQSRGDSMGFLVVWSRPQI